MIKLYALGMQSQRLTLNGLPLPLGQILISCHTTSHRPCRVEKLLHTLRLHTLLASTFGFDVHNLQAVAPSDHHTHMRISALTLRCRSYGVTLKCTSQTKGHIALTQLLHRNHGHNLFTGATLHHAQSKKNKG